MNEVKERLLKCNHRKANGTVDMLTFDEETNMVKCSNCKVSFHPIDMDENVNKKLSE